MLHVGQDLFPRTSTSLVFSLQFHECLSRFFLQVSVGAALPSPEHLVSTPCVSTALLTSVASLTRLWLPVLPVVVVTVAIQVLKGKEQGPHVDRGVNVMTGGFERKALGVSIKFPLLGSPAQGWTYLGGAVQSPDVVCCSGRMAPRAAPWPARPFPGSAHASGQGPMWGSGGPRRPSPWARDRSAEEGICSSLLPAFWFFSFRFHNGLA